MILRRSARLPPLSTSLGDIMWFTLFATSSSAAPSFQLWLIPHLLAVTLPPLWFVGSHLHWHFSGRSYAMLVAALALAIYGTSDGWLALLRLPEWEYVVSVNWRIGQRCLITVPIAFAFSLLACWGLSR